MDALANAMVAAILQWMYQINTLYTLNSHNIICQLHLNKAGGKQGKMNRLDKTEKQKIQNIRNMGESR